MILEICYKHIVHVFRYTPHFIINISTNYKKCEELEKNKIAALCDIKGRKRKVFLSA